MYYPETGKILKHRLVKFITKNSADNQSETDSDRDDDDSKSYGNGPTPFTVVNHSQPKGSKESSEETAEASPTQTEGTMKEQEERYPKREKDSRISKGVPV